MRHTLTPEHEQFATLERAQSLLSEGYVEERRRLVEHAVALYWPHRQSAPTIDALLVAARLRTLNVDAETLVAAILGTAACAAACDRATLEASLERYASPSELSYVINLVESTRKLNTLSLIPNVNAQIGSRTQTESLRRMLFSVVSDVRAILIKLAVRIQELYLLEEHEDDHAQRMARESLEIYAPLANRLGLGQIKWELEDLCFRVLEPRAYKRVAGALEESRASRESYIRNFVADFDERLAHEGFDKVLVVGRPKHIYSIWKKMRNKRIEFHDLFDIRAIRVLVDSIQECYAVLGVAHSSWQPITREFDDYIAHPKENGYRSLHTAVIGPQGKPVEIQIRTRDMDSEAELGFAAHWRYKEGIEEDSTLQKQINGLRQLLADSDDESLIEDLTQTLKADRVFVFTPKGDVVDMVAGSTPLDFAYQVHSEVGHRCRGAKVNGSIVSLTTVLNSGDQVEVLTTREPSPSRDWLNRSLGYLYTSRARAKVRAWFNVQDHEQHLNDGRVILDRELKRAHSVQPIDRIAQVLKFDKPADLYVALARNELTSSQLSATINQLDAPVEHRPVTLPDRRKKHRPRDDQINIVGVGNLMTQIANCCKPVPYDRIVGYITQGRGVSVHRADCSNMLNIDESRQHRLIEVEWGDQQDADYQVEIRVRAVDRQGLLRDVSTVLANQQVNVVAMHTESDVEHQTADLRISLLVDSLQTLNSVTDKIRQLRNVQTVWRLG